MNHRNFDFADPATAHNLHRLDHLSQQSDYSLDNQMLDDFIVAIIQTHELLPQEIQRLVPIAHCYTAGAHLDTTQERRDAVWARIRADLNAGLDLVLQQAPELKDRRDFNRPVTKGERILGLCAEFDQNANQLAIARRLEFEGAGTEVAFDAKELQRLLARKRVPNWTEHEAKITRLIYHIELLAARLHHLS